MAERILSLKKETDIQGQEPQTVQTRWTQSDSLQTISELKWQKLKRES